MNLIQKQDHFAQQYPKLFDDIYRYIAYRIPNQVEAEDLVSEALTKAYARLDAFEQDMAPLRAWVFGFAKNEILMYWRNKKLLVDIDEMDKQADGGIIRSFLERLDQRLLVERILSGLTPQARILVALKYTESLSYEELSTITGKEAPALRKFFSRLHQSLRLQFGEQDSL